MAFLKGTTSWVGPSPKDGGGGASPEASSIRRPRGLPRVQGVPDSLSNSSNLQVLQISFQKGFQEASGDAPPPPARPARRARRVSKPQDPLPGPPGPLQPVNGKRVAGHGKRGAGHGKRGAPATRDPRPRDSAALPPRDPVTRALGTTTTS